jgi:hypothetical protein
LAARVLGRVGVYVAEEELVRSLRSFLGVNVVTEPSSSNSSSSRSYSNSSTTRRLVELLEEYLLCVKMTMSSTTSNIRKKSVSGRRMHAQCMS